MNGLVTSWKVDVQTLTGQGEELTRSLMRMNGSSVCTDSTASICSSTSCLTRAQRTQPRVCVTHECGCDGEVEAERIDDVQLALEHFPAHELHARLTARKLDVEADLRRKFINSHAHLSGASHTLYIYSLSQQASIEPA